MSNGTGRRFPQRSVVPRSIKSVPDSTIKQKQKKKNQGTWIHVAEGEYVLENYCHEADIKCDQKL